MRGNILRLALYVSVLVSVGGWNTHRPSAAIAQQAAIEPDPKLPLCPTPGPYDGKPPTRPYQPGDPVCDARRFAVLQESVRKVPSGASPVSLVNRKTALDQNDEGHGGQLVESIQSLTQYNIGVDSSGNTSLQGIYAGRRVTQPAGQGLYTVYTTMHAGNGGIDWTEVGWRVLDSQPSPHLFTANRLNLWTYPAYPLSAGQTIYLLVQPYNQWWWSPYIW